MIDAKRDLLNNFTVAIDGVVGYTELTKIHDILEVTLSNYTVSFNETLPAVRSNGFDILKLFCASKKIEGSSDSTLKQYYRTANQFLSIAQKNLNDISPNDVRGFLLWLRENGNSERSVNNQRLFLSSFFRWCEDNSYVDKSPCKVIKAIKYDAIDKEPLSELELELLRKSCKTARETAILETLYSTGCRVSELVNLKLIDIDFNNKEVHLFGKGKKHRTSYLNAKACIALQDYLISRKGNSDFIFISDNKPYNPIGKYTIEVIVRNIADRAGVKDVHPHRIRHTTATMALNKGMPIEQVKELLGHESIDTTLIYAKTLSENVKYSNAKYLS